MIVKSDLIAKAEIIINASVDKVWDAFVNPNVISKYMFGTKVSSGWKEGSKITWKGEWQGKSYEDKGKIISIIPKKKLEYTHYSSLSDSKDIPENYHTVTVELSGKNGHTKVSLHQDNNKNEKLREHSEKNWNMMLASMKKIVEEES